MIGAPRLACCVANGEQVVLGEGGHLIFRPSRSVIASWIASVSCARSTTGTSTILPSTEIEPRPAATASSYAATILRAEATSSALGENSSFRIAIWLG